MAKGIKHIKNKPFKIIAEQTGSFIKNYPILVIDDETDNASVDTGDQTYYDDENPDPNYEPKTINRLIRQLLHIFEKKAYVGYTANHMRTYLYMIKVVQPRMDLIYFQKTS